MPSHTELKVGSFLVLKETGAMDPTSLSELKRLKITSDDEAEVSYVDLNGVSVRLWREGVGDIDVFFPGETWQHWFMAPPFNVNLGHAGSRLLSHSIRRFPDGI